MRVLITGAQGFIGTHLTAELVAAGHEVAAIDLAQGDLRSPGTAETLIWEHSPDRVVHLAAKVGRLFGEEDLWETITGNVVATAAVAKACGAAQIPLLYASSSEVYGDGAERVWGERGLYVALPHNAYGLTKRQGEEFCALYAPVRLQVARLSMPYGPGLPPGRGRAALVTFLHQALRHEPIIVHRGAERSWCFVSDTCAALRCLLERGEPGAYNVGRSDNALPLSAIAELACDLVGAPRWLVEVIDPPERQTVVKRLSMSKIRGLGWEPKVSLADGMARTLDWLREREQAVAA